MQCRIQFGRRIWLPLLQVISASSCNVRQFSFGGWYPYQNEPWHWEYNPPGFRDVYWADFPGSAPERGVIVDEP